MSTISARALLKKALRDMGADGLCNPWPDACGCGLNDLCPCGCINLSECLAAHETRDPESGETVYVPVEADQ